MAFSANRSGKMTVLEIVQAVLEKMDSDEVNSIFDTVESRGVASEVRDSFRHITSNSEDYQIESYSNLTVLPDASCFNQLKLPDNVTRVEELWILDEYKSRHCPEWMEPQEFVDYLFSCQDNESVFVPPAGQKSPCFPVGTYCDARFYTSFDGEHIFLSSVDLRCRESLATEDIGARVRISPEFKLEDSFVPPLNADEFPILLNEVIDTCFINFKGVSNSKAQRRAREQKVMKQNNRERLGRQSERLAYPPFGRFARGRKI